MSELYEQAKKKVEASKHLSPHADFILADWLEGDGHWLWVIEADEAEILDWVEACK
jgi:hypothetical protein